MSINLSVLKNKETTKLKTDQVLDVHVAEGCSVKASWDHDIEWDKFGWHESGGSLSFNPVGMDFKIQLFVERNFQGFET